MSLKTTDIVLIFEKTTDKSPYFQQLLEKKIRRRKVGKMKVISKLGIGLVILALCITIVVLIIEALKTEYGRDLDRFSIPFFTLTFCRNCVFAQQKQAHYNSRWL